MFCVKEAGMNKHPEDLNQLILRTANQILLKEGYAKLTMRNVARKSEIALGSIYNYYPSKNDLIAQMMRNYWDDFFQALKANPTKEMSFEEQMEQIFILLNNFLNRFRASWLTIEYYQDKDKLESGHHESEYIRRLVSVVKDILDRERSPSVDSTALNADEWARIIVLNMITMAQFPAFDFTIFRKLLKKAIE